VGFQTYKFSSPLLALQAANSLAAKGVNLNSVHATAAKGGKKAVVVYTVEAAAKAATATAEEHPLLSHVIPPAHQHWLLRFYCFSEEQVL